MTEILLHGQESLEEIHDRFAEALRLPVYYGRNLDALFDCLTDLQEDVTVHLKDPAALEERLGSRGRALTALLRRAAAENPRVRLLEGA